MKGTNRYKSIQILTRGIMLLIGLGLVPVRVSLLLGNEDKVAQEGDLVLQGIGFNLFLTPGDPVLTLGSSDTEQWTRRERARAILQFGFVGADPQSPVAGLEESPGRLGNLIGSDPTIPHTGIARYRKVKYFDVYPGIDLGYRCSQRRLQYELTIKPGADPAAIQLSLQGADALELDERGDLILKLADRELVHKAPVAYQAIDGKRRNIPIELEINERLQVRFKVTGYDRQGPLIISAVFDYNWQPYPIECDLGDGTGYFIPKTGLVVIDKLPYGPHLEYPIEWVYVSGLGEGLGNCPILRNSIVWETGDGQRIFFKNWSTDRKQALYDYYDQLILKGENAQLSISCPDPEKNLHGTSHTILLTATEAFDVYAAHVAWALYLETKNIFPWSLAAESKEGREEILASYRYHSRIRPSQSINSYPSHIQPNEDFQSIFQDDGYGVLRCDPRIGYRFVTGQSADHPFQTENLLGSSQEETLVNLTAWMRRKVGHGSPESRQEMLEKGVFLEDRLNRKQDNYHNPGRWLIDSPGGCHTASSLLYDLAKSVNIPLRHVSTMEDRNCGASFGNCTHGGLVYRWQSPDARVLWHTDNIYADANNDPIFPTDGQGNPVSAQEADKKFKEAFWVSPVELKSWGFEYKLELVDPQTAETKFNAKVSQSYEDFYDYGYVAGYWLRSDRTMDAFSDNEPVLNKLWRSDLSSLFQLERWYQLCSWGLVHYYALSAKSTLDNFLNDSEERKRVGFRSWWLHDHQEYWVRSMACVDAYGGGDAVVGLDNNWNEYRGYPK